MNEPCKRSSRIYLRFKSLPNLSPSEEKKLSMIIRKVSIKKKLLKRTSIKDSINSINFNQISNAENIQKLDNHDSKQVSLNDSVFLEDSQSLSYSLFSVANLESSLLKAKNRVLTEYKNARKDLLYFDENKVFLNLLFGEGSSKDIDTIIFYLGNKHICNMKKTQSSIMRISRNAESQNDDEFKKTAISTQKFNHLQKKKFISQSNTGDQYSQSSNNDSEIAPNIKHNFKLYYKTERSLELMKNQTKIFKCDLHECCNNANKTFQNYSFLLLNENNRKKLDNSTNWEIMNPFRKKDEDNNRIRKRSRGKSLEEHTKLNHEEEVNYTL